VIAGMIDFLDAPPDAKDGEPQAAPGRGSHSDARRRQPAAA
jgi:hypothetical protein